LLESGLLLLQGKGYDMPSSHTQFLALSFLSLSLFLLIRHRARRQRAIPTNPTHTDPSHCRRALLSPLTLSLAAIVVASRIYLSYHTPIQVNCGM